jgi:hypothetical protein
MLRHVVLFRWSTDATAEARAAATDGLDGLPAAIEAIARYHHGPDAGLAEGNWDHVVVGDFADEAAYAEYRDHPVHRALIAEHIRPILAERAAVQYRIED